MTRQGLIITILIAGGAAGTWGILRSSPLPRAESGSEHDGNSDSPREEKGPHGGRLLHDGDIEAEIQIVDRDDGAFFQLYAWRSGQPLAPGSLKANVELTRLGGVVEQHQFAPRDDRLEGTSPVGEPHSFDVKLKLSANGPSYEWSYPSYEARVEIPAKTAAGAGIVIAQAGPARIRETVLLYGSIVQDERRVRSVGARFPGVIREVKVNLGDRVSTGDVLARIESNESLEVYPVRSPIGGVVLSRMANPGEIAGEAPLFSVGDLSRVWAELAMFRRDVRKVRVGQVVRVRADDDSVDSEGTISFISPIGSGESQSVRVRVSLDNADGRWQPGMFVRGDVAIAERDVPVAIDRAGVQTWRDFDVAFIQVGDLYEPRVLELGATDNERIEVLSGLEARANYVAANSFLIKADIGKAGAAHED